MVAEIKLPKGHKAIVDDDDFEYLNQFKWCNNGNGYVTHRFDNGTGRLVKTGMHKIVLERKLGRKLLPTEETDHIDNNPLNNTRANLRASTHQENTRNRSKTNSPASSRFKGVSKSKNAKKWSAQIKIDQKLIYLGSFNTEDAAARAYDAAARAHFGEFAKLNFPDKVYHLNDILRTECSSRYGSPDFTQA